MAGAGPSHRRACWFFLICVFFYHPMWLYSTCSRAFARPQIGCFALHVTMGGSVDADDDCLKSCACHRNICSIWFSRNRALSNDSHARVTIICVEYGRRFVDIARDIVGISPSKSMVAHKNVRCLTESADADIHHHPINTECCFLVGKFIREKKTASSVSILCVIYSE